MIVGNSIWLQILYGCFLRVFQTDLYYVLPFFPKVCFVAKKNRLHLISFLYFTYLCARLFLMARFDFECRWYFRPLVDQYQEIYFWWQMFPTFILIVMICFTLHNSMFRHMPHARTHSYSIHLYLFCVLNWYGKYDVAIIVIILINSDYQDLLKHF